MIDRKERVDALMTQKSFSICSAPITVIRDFKVFCKIETKDDYSLGLKLLLERNKMNFQQEVFAMKIQELEAKNQELEARITILENGDDEEKQKEPKVKTFGAGGERK